MEEYLQLSDHRPLSSWSQNNKGLVFNSPNDTGVIYFPAAHPLAGLLPQALGRDPCLTPQLSGHWAPPHQRPSTQELLADTFSSLIQYALLI